MAGVKGKSGRKSRAEELGLRALLDECVSPTARKQLFRRLVKLSKQQDKIGIEATKLLLAYLYGSPRQSLEVSGPDRGPIEVVAVDYRTAIAPLAPGSVGDSDTPGEGQGAVDGP